MRVTQQFSKILFIHLAFSGLLTLEILNAQPVPEGQGIWVTGRNAEGQLGLGTSDNMITSLSRINEEFSENITFMCAGENHSYYLTTDGKLWASGANDFGQIGNGNNINQNTLTPVNNGSDVHRVFAGKNHGLFIKSDGTLWGMGCNENGQLGDGSKINRNEPVMIAEQVTWAAGGESHSLFIKADASLWAVGLNEHGQLGDGTINEITSPVMIASGVHRVFAGWTNSYFIKTDGTLWATGNNSFGMLGIGEPSGTTPYITIPAQVTGGTDVISVAVKTEHMYFLKANKQLWAVGRNNYGQLGNGIPGDSYSPVQVKNGTNVTTIAAGDGFGVFLKSDSTLWALGNPAEGRMAFDASDEQKMPLWVFNRYKGDVHNHSSYTWSHGSHRTGGSNWDPIKSDWNPPPGMGSGGGPGEFPPVLNPKGVIDPNYYTRHSGPQVYQMDRAKNRGPAFQFYVTSDHCHESPFHPVDPANNEYWEDIRESARNTIIDPDFVGMSGMEYSRNSDPQGTGSGHQVYINTHDYVSAMHADAIGIPQLYNWLKTARPLDDKGYVVLNFAHPGRTQYNDWAHWDQQIVDIATLCEITTVYRSTYLAGWHRSLNKGWKTSPTGVQDSHGFWNLENRVPLTNILSTELSTEAITRAMRQRRTYVSWTNKDDRTDTDLRYSVNDFIMGSTLDNSGVYNFNIEIETPEGRTSNYVRRIQIIRNHPTNLDNTQVAAEMVFPGNQSKVIWSPTITDSDAKWFYLQVHHWADTNNDPNNTTYTSLGSTYSAPIWTGAGIHHGDGSHAIHHAVESFSTPVKISSRVVDVATGSNHTLVMSGAKPFLVNRQEIESHQKTTVKLFPNPAKDFVNLIVNGNDNDFHDLRLLDISGKTIKTWRLSSFSERLELSSLQPGFYVMLIASGNNKYRFEKLIIEH